MGTKKLAKPVAKKHDNKDLREEAVTNVNGSTAILKNVEILFWSYKPISNNPQYEPKYAVTVKLEDKHLRQLAAAKASAIQWYINEKDEDLDPDTEFSDSIYHRENGETTYTFRSSADFRESTEVGGEECDPDIKIGRGSVANIAVRACASKIFKSYTVTFYMNAVNITDLAECGSGHIDLRAALR